MRLYSSFKMFTNFHEIRVAWDTDDIDKWKLDPFKREDNPHSFVETSSFMTLFPKYQEKNLREIWSQVTQVLQPLGIHAQLNLIEGSMTVSTTSKTYDPYIILKARDLIQLLARSVPFHRAKDILLDENYMDIIKIHGLVKSQEVFVKRRQRLLGPEGHTLKAIELLTNTSLWIQGHTVACIGTPHGLKQVRRLVLDCMANIHPIYHIKRLMIQRELKKDSTLKNESWDRFLPQFHKTAAKKKLKSKKKSDKAKKKEKNKPLFPPLPQPRLEDKLMESGEYFLRSDEKEKLKIIKRKEHELALKQIKFEEKAKQFIPPSETIPSNFKKSTAVLTTDSVKEEGIEALKLKFMKKKVKNSK
ncbi:Ribosomal RNA assembly protein mis3 [Coelomomyces lativittatus]|nr:Ribosomal RNA assembly protein mis3 [Coelomomyces lativittatus]